MNATDLYLEYMANGLSVVGYNVADAYETPILIESRSDRASIRLDLSLADAQELVIKLQAAIKFSTPEPAASVCLCDVGSDDMQLCPIHGSNVQ